jgi:hypothetical protein
VALRWGIVCVLGRRSRWSPAYRRWSTSSAALRWSVDHFVPALTRSVPRGRLVSLCFFWLSWLDRFLDPKHSVDAASSVFFLGRKTDRPITRADIIDYHQGGM